MLSFTLASYILTTNYLKNMYTMFLVKKNCIYIILYYLRYIIKLQIYLYEHGIKYEIKKNKIPYLDTK